tara:strand:+ start:174 stop:497 length:324 start_codon:yes stop_codon:yes gene_type:complete
MENREMKKLLAVWCEIEDERGCLYLAKVKNKRQYEIVWVPNAFHFWNAGDNAKVLYVSNKSYEDTIFDITSALISHATFWVPRQGALERVYFDWETLSSKREILTKN